jgi:hypothetical protein
MIAVSVLSLLIPALAGAVAAKRLVGPGEPAARVGAWFIVAAALVILPIQLAASLQLLGMVTRIPIATPAVIGAVVLVLLVGRGRSAGALGSDPARTVPESATGRRAVRWAALIVAGTYGIVALDRAIGFPMSWDGLAYHLPLAVKWLQDGSFALMAASDWRESLPGNAEIVGMLALGTGWQALAEMWNVVSTLGLCAGSYLLAREMGVGSPGAQAGAVLVASVPIVLFQTFSAYVDLFGSACLIAGLGLFVTSRPGSPRPLPAAILSGFACGLAVGTKPTLWPYAALVAAAILTSLIWAGPASGGRPRLVLGFVLATAAPCLFWFVRSFLATGNPFYPLAVEIPGFLSLTGFRPSQITDPNYHLNFVGSRGEWLLYPWVEFKRQGYGFSESSGLGPVFAGFVPVGVLYTLWSLPRMAPGRARSVRLASLAGLALGSAVWWIAIQSMPRFALPLIVLACVLSTPFLDAAVRFRPRAAGALLIAAALVSALLSTLPTAHDVPRRIRHDLWARFRVYEVPQLVDQLPACSIAVNYNPLSEFWNNFALAGSRLANRVVPPWAVSQALDRSPEPGCSTYLFDRAPFMSAEQEADVTRKGYTQVGLPSEMRWRVWQRTTR